ncbi:MAG: ABC transporter substrate-binding protein, partial [Anaerolineae bacterium]|nr:ABC transporter substrate-binding protein [Anaerolineae bacterium]
MKRYILTITLMAVLTMLVACATPEPTKPAATVAPTKVAEPTKPAATVAPTKAAEPTKPAATATAVVKFNEAPMLAEQVKAGKLPPVEQRLPKNPVVVPTVEKIGKYGGTWRVGLSGGNDQVGLYRMVGYEGLVRWDPSFKEIIPNLAESFQANADASEYTFKLREGLKWSNGKPFTANDIMFWYEDILLNKDLTPTIPTWLTVNDKPVVVEKVNDYTVKFKFAGPYGLFLQRLGHPDGTRITAFPADYLKQFIPKYNPDADKQAKDAGLKTWVDLFNAKIGAGERSAGYYANLELPRLIAWIPVTSYDGKATQVTLERNPYYWKVDSQGNQLPYIDRVQATIAGDVQALVLKALNGEIDMQDRHIATLANKAVFADGMQKGNYRFYELIPSQSSTFVIMLNMTHKDPVKRAVFQNKDFRIGLSYAINRKEIIDTVYVGQGKPFQ